MYVGETGHKFECRLADHKRREGNVTSSSLNARHFVEGNHKFVNLVERELREELEILKERQKDLNSLINSKVKFDNEDIY